MAYADLLEDEVAQSQYLIVLKPRRRVTSFTLFSGSVYRAAFDYGECTSAWADGVALTQGSSAVLSAGEFWHDVANDFLYVRLSGGGDPDTVWLVAAFEVYCGTIDAHHYRVATDSTTRVVYWEPIVSKSPMFKATASDSEFGFNPVQSSSLVLNNAENIFERFLHDSSFNRAECIVYHWLGDLLTANVKRVLNGFTTNASLDPPKLTLKITDRVDQLSNEWRNAAGSLSFYDLATYPSLDPQSIGRAVRRVYGRVDGFEPVNVDYVIESPTTSDNRDWAVITGQTGLDQVSRTVPASPVSTTVRTYVNSVNGLNVGDSIWFDKASDEYAFVTAVGADYIEHAALSVACTTGDLVKRGFVGSVSIIQNEVEYVAHYNRDYTISTAMAGGISGFSFSTSLEANLSIPNTLSASDRVHCRVYGRRNDLTLGGPAFGSDDSRTDNMAHPAQVVLDILKGQLGVSESDINAAAFTAALTDQSSGVGLAIPERATSSEFPKLRDTLGVLTKSALFKLLINDDADWSIVTTKPLGAVTKTIADDEILRGSIGWDYDYSDVVSQVSIEYNAREVALTRSSEDTVSVASATSDMATYVHQASATLTQRSCWAYESEAQELADRMAFVMGERRGKVTLRTKNRFYATKLGDNIQVDLVSLPGFEYNGETVNSREHAVIEVERSKDQVTIKLDDRKGVEDNSGGW